MEINSVITLEDGLIVELLDKVEYQNSNFFLAETLINEIPSGEYNILKEIKENDEYYMEKETSDEVLVEVLKLFTEKLGKLVGQVSMEEILD